MGNFRIILKFLPVIVLVVFLPTFHSRIAEILHSIAVTTMSKKPPVQLTNQLPCTLHIYRQSPECNIILQQLY
jgi:hypothetical protein